MRRRRTQKNKQSQTIYVRFLFIVGVWVIWGLAIGVQLVHLQVNQHEELSRKASNQRRQKTNEKQLRGTIYDRTGERMAISVNAESLFVNPDKIENLEATAGKLAPILKEKPQAIVARIKRAKEEGKKNFRLAPELDDEKVDKIKEYGIAGISWEKDQKRTYPHLTTAAQVIGFSNLEDKGQSGIEASQEKHLRGEMIGGYKERDRLGRVYESSENNAEPPKDVHLTIHAMIQYEAEKALKQGIDASGAKGGTAIVMDPKTGEILAMVSMPGFDLNAYRTTAPAVWKNKSIEEYYSPGSVFKLITYGAALDAGLISPNEELDCNNGSITVAGHKFTDGHPLGMASVTKALSVSNNVAAIKIAQRLDKERFYDYSRRFGFGLQSGVELPSETSGILRSPKGWAGDSLASMSIGYEVGVTSLQMASAYATIANDGVRVQPYVVREIGEEGKDPVYSAQPQRTQVVSAEAARTLRNMMRDVITTGTGKRAQLEGYTAAGKTGTAWKYDQKKGYSEGKRISSFIGMAPAENPAVVISVMLDEPSIGDRSGGTVAAPVFKMIAEQVLPRLNVLPDKDVHAQPVRPEVIKEFGEGTGSPTEGKILKNADSTETDKKKADSVEIKTADTKADKNADKSADKNKAVKESKEKKPADKNGDKNSKEKNSAELKKKPETKPKSEKDKKAKPGSKT